MKVVPSKPNNAKSIVTRCNEGQHEIDEGETETVKNTNSIVQLNSNHTSHSHKIINNPEKVVEVIWGHSLCQYVCNW